MADDDLRHAVWAHLERSLSATETVQDYLQSAVDLIGPLIRVDGSYCLSTLLYDSPFTVATTDRDAWDADQVEFDTESGPCVDGLRTGQLHPRVDILTERRWPAWAATAAALGFRSAAAVPVELEPGHRLVLNLYSRQPDAFAGSVLDRAQQFMEELARTMPLAMRLSQQAEVVAQLQEALASRSTIDQALGVLMGQNRCTRDEAFGILRRASQNRNVKLRDVASSVIERFTGHAPAPSPAFRTAVPDVPLPSAPAQVERAH